MIEKKRQATYVVQVPMQITFATDYDLEFEELYKRAKAEIQKRLVSGYFDVLVDEADVISTTPHRTREEIQAERVAWREFWDNAGVRGLR